MCQRRRTCWCGAWVRKNQLRKMSAKYSWIDEYITFRTKVPEISGGQNGRQDQLFWVDARAHRPPLHRVHSIYQSKSNHLEQMTLVTFISVRLTLRLSVFFQLYFKVPDLTLSGCCLDQHSVQVYSAAKPRIITCRITTNSMLNSLFFKHTLCFLFFFSPHF